MFVNVYKYVRIILCNFIRVQKKNMKKLKNKKATEKKSSSGMQFVFVGLGNPGEAYTNTRHNVGFLVLDHFRESFRFPHWVENGKTTALLSKDTLGKHTVTLVLPQTFMNKSGSSVKKLVTNKKATERLVVVYDDLDLPLGNIKISFGRSSGGHKGVESIIKSIGTKDFVRVRVGVSHATAAGKIKKPKGERAVLDFILKEFRKPEQEQLKKIFKQTDRALELLATEGRAKAMNECN